MRKEAGQVWVSPIDGAEMVGVPAGEFTMGSNKWESDERPAHVVYLDAYYLRVGRQAAALRARVGKGGTRDG